jgi:hypothetical protein
MISFPESLSLLLNESPTLAKSLSRRTAMQTRDKRRRVPCGEDLDHLERYRKMGHHTVATAAALYYCKTRRICPPEWLVEEAALFIVEMLKHEKAPAQGRNASQLARFRQNVVISNAGLPCRRSAQCVRAPSKMTVASRPIRIRLPTGYGLIGKEGLVET